MMIALPLQKLKHKGEIEMKIRDLKDDNSIMMVIDANKEVKEIVYDMVCKIETDKLYDFLDSFMDFYFIDFGVDDFKEPYFGIELVADVGTYEFEQIIEKVKALDNYNTDFNMYEIFKAFDQFKQGIDDEDCSMVTKAYDTIRELLTEGCHEARKRVDEREYLLVEFKAYLNDCVYKFKNLKENYDDIENIIDKEIDDDFCIIEEPQTPKMRKFKEASDEDFDKIWKNNPKFVEMIQEHFIKEQNDVLREEIFNKIEGATTYIDVENTICAISVYDKSSFTKNLLDIEYLQNYFAFNNIEEIVTKNEGLTDDDILKIISELTSIIESENDYVNDNSELKEHLSYMEQEEMIDEEHLYYDDNFILYHIKSFA